MKLFPLNIVQLLLLLPAALGLYDNAADVQTITSRSDFRESVLESDSIWIVQFYAPWCGHCQQFVPAYEQLGSLLKGIVPVAAVDATAQEGLAQEYGVKGFPTMKMFGEDKSNPKDLNTRDSNDLVNTVFAEIQKTVESRGDAMNGGGGKSSGSNSQQGSKKAPKGSKVVQLSASNFEETVYNNPEVSLVAFVAPWCGHCKALLPEWADASTKLVGSGAFLGLVDATVETSLAQDFGVQGYPTIKVFPGGLGKTKSSAMDYQGPRESRDIVQYALEEVDRSGVPKEISELTGPEVMTETCSAPNSICVFFALPHILDTGAEGRNKYKEIMGAASKAVRGMSFNFLWFEGTSQPKLEDSLELTFGFPSVAAYSVDKGVYAVHRGSFSEKNIRKFLTGITTGKQPTYQIRNVPTIENVEPWDGLDGVPFEEEPLEDIMGWDDEDEL